MKRVVITGIGVLSPIGNDADSISDSLNEWEIRFNIESRLH